MASYSEAAAAALDEALAISTNVVGDHVFELSGSQQWERWEVLSRVAAAMAWLDSDRALRLADQIPRDYFGSHRGPALVEVIRGLVVRNPAKARVVSLRAESEAEDARRRYGWASYSGFLAALSEAVRKADPGRARELASKALEIVRERSVYDDNYRADVLLTVAFRLRASERGIAREAAGIALDLAREQKDDDWRTDQLTEVAAALAAIDTQKAIEVALSVGGLTEAGRKSNRVRALVSVARSLEGADPQQFLSVLAQGLKLAHSITDEVFRDYALHNICEAMAERDPDRALEIAWDISDTSFSRIAALCDVAKAYIHRDLKLAQEVAVEASDLARRTGEEGAFVAGALSLTLCLTEPERAKAIADKIGDPNRDGMLRDMALLTASQDVERALTLVRSIRSERERCWALCDVARAMIGRKEWYPSVRDYPFA